MGLKEAAEKKAVETFVNHELTKLEKDPIGTFKNLMGYAKKLKVFEDETFDKAIRIADDPDNGWTKFGIDLAQNIDRNILFKTIMNFGYEASLRGSKIRAKNREELGTNLPWTILFDPTSACNLHCIGCWAAEYGNKLNLTFEEMDSIVTQGKELGIYFYLVTGGEPLVRKNDLIKLAEKHNDCCFHIFTNGTLIDREFCKEVKRVGNMNFAVSLEGYEADNDFRRGEGVYKKVIQAMQLMKEEGLLFGNAVCYTSKNIETVTSDEFLQLLVDNGSKILWYFHYMPVGKDAVVELMPSPEQRKYMVDRFKEIRCPNPKIPIVAFDFQNDGRLINGCIAGGKDYMHINANGDVEPCVFIHYSSANIREVSLKEALAQPLFMAYKEHQPFNSNHFRPCPMLENPELLRRMVKETGAKSTDLIEAEDVDQLCAKCDQYAENWKSTADELWKEYKPKKKETTTK
ncbi:MAG: radical SAM protein [Ezakiella sp.]|nr:radical SAM protein [Ezakiella sp.]MDD7472413.1 radical SAM protein [Bacillota bacterium]MDY3923147.1 radical SAM protein [Ezakiella sp.]